MKKFALLLVALCLVVGVSGAAWAYDLDIEVGMGWDVGATHFNCHVEVTLLDNQDQPIEGFIAVPMNYNSGYTQWWVTLLDLPPGATTVRFEWIPEDQQDLFWIGNGVIADGLAEAPVNWMGATVIEVAALLDQ